MSTLVSIPSPLTVHTGGIREVTVQGRTLATVMEELEASHPGIRQAMCDDSGRILRFLAVFVDGTDVRTLQGLATPVGPDSRIDIVAAIAGG